MKISNHPDGYINHFETTRIERVPANPTVFETLPMGSLKARNYGCRCSETQMSNCCQIHTVERVVNTVATVQPGAKIEARIIIGM